MISSLHLHEHKLKQSILFVIDLFSPPFFFLIPSNLWESWDFDFVVSFRILWFWILKVHGFSTQPHLRDNARKSLLKMRLCLFGCSTPSWVGVHPPPTLCCAWTHPHPVPWSGPGASTPKSSPTIGPGRDHTQPHFGLSRVHAQLHGGLGYVCAPFSPALRAWIEPNIPQIGCITNGSLYTKPPYSGFVLIIMIPITSY